MIAKQNLRKTFLKKRLNLSTAVVLKKSLKIANLLLKIPEIRAQSNFSLYLPIKNEVETNLIIDALILRTATILVPAYSDKVKGYVFSKFGNWQSLEKGPRGILQPIVIEPVDPSIIDIAILPGLVFSKTGIRLGYGKGVFDRLLAKSKAVRIGLAYDFQVVGEIPQEEHDLVMDFVVTEKKIVII